MACNQLREKQAGYKHTWLEILRLPLEEYTVINMIACGKRSRAAPGSWEGRGIFH